MQAPDEYRALTGEEAHLKLVQMIKDYNVMLTGVSANSIGKNHAQTCLLPKSALAIPDFVENESKAMLEPSNSCGNISNQICDLFLGPAKATDFAKGPYIPLSNRGENLLAALNESNDYLVRFEMDRKINKSLIIFREDIASIEDFQQRLDKAIPNTMPNSEEVVIIKDSLCYVHYDKETQKRRVIDLTPSAEDKALLQRLIEPCVQVSAKQKGISPETMRSQMESIGIFEDFDPNDDEMIVLEDFVKQQLSHCEDSWVSTHSFTAFIPKPKAGEVAIPHQYQAYARQHNLQNWVNNGHGEKLSQLGVEGYVNKLSTLATADSPSELWKIEQSLFDLKLGGALATTQRARIKYQVTPVQPQLLYENLSQLQAWINEKYPGDTPELQVAAYEREAKKSLLECLTTQAKEQNIQLTLDYKSATKALTGAAANDIDVGMAPSKA